MDLEFIDTFSALAGIQGIILSAILAFAKRHNNKSNRYLSLFIVVISINLLRSYFEGRGIEDYTIIYILSWGLIILYGPFIYFYVRSLTGRQMLLKRDLLPHLVVPSLYFLFLVYGLIFGLTTEEEIVKKPVEFAVYTSFQLFIVLQILFYLIRSLMTLKHHQKRIKDQYSNIDQLNLSWLYKLVLSILVVVLVWIAVYGGDILFLKNYNIPVPVNLVILLLACLIYWIGYAALLKPEVFIEPVKAKSKETSITREDINRYKPRLIELLEKEKIYLNPQLTIQELSKQLGTNSKVTSQLINTEFRKTFFHIINQYRLEEVKVNLLREELNHLTIEGIAFDSGFNSSSTLNRLFKEHTGMTPTQYRSKSGK